MFWLPLIGAGLGLAKGLSAKAQERKDRQLASEMWKTSPWTGVRPGAVQRANVLGDVVGGAAMGAQFVPGKSWEKLFETGQQADIGKMVDQSLQNVSGNPGDVGRLTISPSGEQEFMTIPEGTPENSVDQMFDPRAPLNRKTPYWFKDYA